MDIDTIRSSYGIDRIPDQSDYPEDDAVMVLSRIDTKMAVEDFQLVTRESVHRVKKLFKNIEDHASVEVGVYEGEVVNDIRGRTIKPDGTILELTPTDFHRTTGGDASVFYSDVQTIRFTFPGIEKNCLVEYAYTKFKPHAFRRDFWMTQFYIPALRNEYRLSVPSILLAPLAQGGFNWAWRYKTYGNVVVRNPVAESPINPGGRYTKEAVFTWLLQDVPAFDPEPSMPSHDRYIGYVQFAPSDWEHWNDISEWYYQDLFEPRLLLTDQIRSQAARLAEGSTHERENIGAAYLYAQGLRYVAIELGIGGIQPNFPQTVLDRQYGDCKDKSILLVGLLKSMDIDARPVLVLTASEGSIDPDFPSWRFNHMIVRAETRDRQVYWMDPTNDFSPLGELPAGCENVFVLVLNPDGTSKLERTPRSTHLDNVTTIDLKATLSADHASQLSVTMTYSGERNVRMRRLFKDKTDREMREFCKALIVDDYVNATVGSYAFTPLDSVSSDLVLTFDVTVPNALQKQGDLYFVKADPFKFFSDLGWLVKEERRFPVEFSYPYTVRKTVAIAFPPNVFAVRNLPEKLSVVSDEFLFRADYQSTSPALVTMSESFSVKTTELSPRKYRDTKKLFETVKNKVNETIVLTRK